MKQIISTLIILLLSNLTLCCESKTGNLKTDAECCANENPPSWCPNRPNDNEVKSGISKASRSPQARQFVMRQSEGSVQSSSMEPQKMNFSSHSSSQNKTFFPGPGLGPGFGHFWPMQCPWWKWCCRFCYFLHISLPSWPNWYGYLMCIWNSCHYGGGPWGYGGPGGFGGFGGPGGSEGSGSPFGLSSKDKFKFKSPMHRSQP